MLNKFGFLGLAFLCLLPAFHAYNETSSRNSSASWNSMFSFWERVKINGLAIKEFSVVKTQILDESPKVFNKVRNDPKVLEIKTEAMESLTALLKDYVDKIEDSKNATNEPGVLDILEDYNQIVKKFNSKKQANLSPEAVIIEKSLKENGLDDIEKSVREHYEALFPQVTAEVDKYINGFDEADEENERPLIAWFAKFKAEDNTDKKIEILDQLPY